MLSVLALLLFAGDTLLPAIHKLAVQHRVCAAHGEWIHAEEAAKHANEPKRGDGYLPGERDHHHGHCEACTGARQDPSPALGSLSAAPEAVLPALAERLSAGCASPSERRFRVAPKQGPPAFG